MTGHVPVMLKQVLRAFEPLHRASGGLIVDGTFGTGGHSRALLHTYANVQLLAIDKDARHVDSESAKQLKRDFGARFRIEQASFGDMQNFIAPHEPVRAVLLDVGFCSTQVDDPQRGFSFQADAPLDMRFDDVNNALTAAQIVNKYDEVLLSRLFNTFGERRLAASIAAKIATRRLEAPIETTRELADLILMVARRRNNKSSRRQSADRAWQSVRRVFLALRSAVNDELGELQRGLVAARGALACDGTLAVLTFHSLEHGIAADFFRHNSALNRHRERQRHAHLLQTQSTAADDDFTELLDRLERDGQFGSLERRAFDLPVTKKPSKTEIAENSRAKPAQLRYATKQL